MRVLINCIVFILFAHMNLAQTEIKNEPSLNLEGQVAVSTNGKAMWYNMGGPAIKFNFKRIAFGIGMFPSLKFQQDEPRPIMMPILGVGPQFYFLKNRRFVLSFPCYYLSAHNSWELTAGIGYVLTRPKK